MTFNLQNLRTPFSGQEPEGLLPGQLCFNLPDKVVYVGDGTSTKKDLEGNQTTGLPGQGWFSTSLDPQYFLLNPEKYSSAPSDNQVLAYSVALGKPIWKDPAENDRPTQYYLTSQEVTDAPGVEVSDKIKNALGVTGIQADTVVVSGSPEQTYPGLYVYQNDSWTFSSLYAAPVANEIPFNPSGSGVSGVNVQSAITEVSLSKVDLPDLPPAPNSVLFFDGLRNIWLPYQPLLVTIEGVSPITVDSVNPVNPVVGINNSTVSARGAVQLASDAETQSGLESSKAVTPSGLQSKVSSSTSLSSGTTIASSSAVKNTYDLANTANSKANNNAISIGTLSNLQTSDKSSIVNAINEQETCLGLTYGLANAAVPRSCYTALGSLGAGTGVGTVGTLPVGTSGQVLAVNSATSTGLQWCTLPLACVPCSSYAAVGTILAGTGAGTYCALPVGTDGQVILANSACAEGVEWTTCPALDICGFTCCSGNFSVAIGFQAGSALTSTGFSNVFVGYNAGCQMSGGDYNVAVGNNSLQGTGSSNIAIGSGAMGQTASSGNFNVAIGHQSSDALTSGSNNVGVGTCSLGAATSGSFNLALGHGSGSSVTTGCFNVFVGCGSGDAVTTGSNNTIIGDVPGTSGLSSNVILAAGNTVRFQSNSSGAWSPNGVNYGSAGQILVSAGTGAPPAWTSSASVPANYGSFLSTSTQTNLDTTNGNAVTFDTTDVSNNFFVTSGTRITAAAAGTYSLTVSFQIQKTDGGTDDVNVWFKKNGVNIDNSAFNLTLIGGGAAQLATTPWIVTMASGDYIEAWWWSTDPSAQLLAEPAAAPYPAVPAVNAVIMPVGA
jgi:hypothetical protein